MNWSATFTLICSLLVASSPPSEAFAPNLLTAQKHATAALHSTTPNQDEEGSSLDRGGLLQRFHTSKDVIYRPNLAKRRSFPDRQQHTSKDVVREDHDNVFYRQQVSPMETPVHKFPKDVLPQKEAYVYCHGERPNPSRTSKDVVSREDDRVYHKETLPADDHKFPKDVIHRDSEQDSVQWEPLKQKRTSKDVRGYHDDEPQVRVMTNGAESGMTQKQTSKDVRDYRDETSIRVSHSGREQKTTSKDVRGYHDEPIPTRVSADSSPSAENKFPKDVITREHVKPDTAPWGLERKARTSKDVRGYHDEASIRMSESGLRQKATSKDVRGYHDEPIPTRAPPSDSPNAHQNKFPKDVIVRHHDAIGLRKPLQPDSWGQLMPKVSSKDVRGYHDESKPTRVTDTEAGRNQKVTSKDVRGYHDEKPPIRVSADESLSTQNKFPKDVNAFHDETVNRSSHQSEATNKYPKGVIGDDDMTAVKTPYLGRPNIRTSKDVVEEQEPVFEKPRRETSKDVVKDEEHSYVKPSRTTSKDVVREEEFVFKKPSRATSKDVVKPDETVFVKPSPKGSKDVIMTDETAYYPDGRPHSSKDVIPHQDFLPGPQPVRSFDGSKNVIQRDETTYYPAGTPRTSKDVICRDETTCYPAGTPRTSKDVIKRDDTAYYPAGTPRTSKDVIKRDDTTNYPGGTPTTSKDVIGDEGPRGLDTKPR